MRVEKLMISSSWREFPSHAVSWLYLASLKTLSSQAGLTLHTHLPLEMGTAPSKALFPSRTSSFSLTAQGLRTDLKCGWWESGRC